MKRGDIVTVVLQGVYGKPRPAIVIESDLLPPSDSVLVCLISSSLHQAGPFRRHSLDASPATGLRVASQAMVDKIITVRRTKCGPPTGRVEPSSMRELTGKLAVVMGVED